MPKTGALIVVDGSYGEGGGALFRTALCMAAVTEQPVKITNIRGGSKFAGLDGEDLLLLNALSEATAAEVSGAEMGASSISFMPTRSARGLNQSLPLLRNEANRAPNAPTVLSALLPVLSRTYMYSSLLAEGETYGAHSLSYDYFANVTLYAQKAFGLYAFPTLESAGFGRESAGEISIDLEPTSLKGIQWLDKGALQGVYAIVASSGVSSNIGERAISHLKKLGQSANLPMEAVHLDVPSKNAGVYVTTWATYERGVGGAGAMGGRGIRVEALAQNSFSETFAWMSSSATMDPFVADQVLLTAVLAEGESVFKVSTLTQRFLTSIWVVKQFIPIHITVRGSEGGPGQVTIRRA